MKKNEREKDKKSALVNLKTLTKLAIFSAPKQGLHNMVKLVAEAKKDKDR